MLSANGYSVVSVADGASVERAIQSRPPDIAVLDVGLPGGTDGFGIAERLRGRFDTPVIFLTAADAEVDRLRGFEVGAEDYVVKPFSVRELLARMQVVLRRRTPLPAERLEFMDLTLDRQTRTAHRGAALLALTPTEFDLLETLAMTPGRPWTKRQLLQLVWGIDRYTPHLVEVHISALRRKLEVHGPRLILTARGSGYMLVG